MKSGPISGFKAYDLRGRIPSELNEDVAYRVGREYADFVRPRRVIVGRDIRLSSEQLSKSLEQGLLDAGVDVHDIGLCGTECVSTQSNPRHCGACNRTCSVGSSCTNGGCTTTPTGAAREGVAEVTPPLGLNYLHTHLAFEVDEVEIGPEIEFFESHFNLGNIYHDLGRFTEAQSCYREALRLNPFYADGHFYLHDGSAWSFYKAGFLDE